MNDVPPMPEAFRRDYRRWMERREPILDRLWKLHPCMGSDCGYPTCDNCVKVMEEVRRLVGPPPDPAHYGRWD